MSDVAPELRLRRPLLRMIGTLRPIRAGYQARPVTAVGLVVLVIVGVLTLAVTVPLAGQVPWLPFVAVPVVVLVGPLAYLVFTIAASTWYGYGAGHPMLQVADGEVRGRLRGVWADELADADPAAPDWWDLRLPVRALTGVRVDRDRPGGPLLVLDVPPAVAEALTGGDGTGKLAGHWRDRVGSPAAWQVGLYEGRFGRERRLRALLDALAAAGAPRP